MSQKVNVKRKELSESEKRYVRDCQNEITKINEEIEEIADEAEYSENKALRVRRLIGSRNHMLKTIALIKGESA